MGSIIACLENKLTAVKSILKISSFEKLKNCSFQYDEAVFPVSHVGWSTLACNYKYKVDLTQIKKTIFLQNGRKENVWIVGILVLTFLEIPF